MKRILVVLILILTVFVLPGGARSQVVAPRAEDPSRAMQIAEPPAITLAQGLRQVAESGRQVQIARDGEGIAAADVGLARAGFLPLLNASTSHTSLAYQVQGLTTASTLVGGRIVPQKIVVAQAPSDYWSYSASIQQTLFDFWRTLSRYRGSQVSLDNRRFETARVQNLAALEFALAYFDLLEARKVAATATQEVERLEAHVRDANSLYTSGAITKNDLLQAEVRLKDGRQRQLNARNAEALQASRTNNLLLRPLNEPVRVLDIEYQVEELPFGVEEAWDLALKGRPEVQIVNGSIRALELEGTARRADYYPTFFARGGVDYAQNQFLVHKTNLSAIIGMTVNLFAGGATRAELAKNRSQQDQVLKQRAKLFDDIRLEVQKYLLDLASARERIEVNRGAAEQATENLRINRVRYEAGEGTATEVLDAVTLLTVAENNFIRANYDFRRAEAGTYYAVGKDLREVYK